MLLATRPRGPIGPTSCPQQSLVLNGRKPVYSFHREKNKAYSVRLLQTTPRRSHLRTPPPLASCSPSDSYGDGFAFSLDRTSVRNAAGPTAFTALICGRPAADGPALLGRAVSAIGHLYCMGPRSSRRPSRCVARSSVTIRTAPALDARPPES